MTLLAEFLLARIAEDEEAAKACLDVNQLADMLNGAGPRRWTSDGRIVRDSAERSHDQIVRVGHTWASEGAHIARWDPARVLAECEAKRRIVEIHDDGHDECAGGWLGTWGEPSPGCVTLGALALPYADHPDYLPEWRPDPVNAE